MQWHLLDKIKRNWLRDTFCISKEKAFGISSRQFTADNSLTYKEAGEMIRREDIGRGVSLLSVLRDYLFSHRMNKPQQTENNTFPPLHLVPMLSCSPSSQYASSTTGSAATAAASLKATAAAMTDTAETTAGAVLTAQH